MSPFLLVLQLLVLFQVVFADKAHDIAIKLDKALNEPESLEALKNLIVVPFDTESCGVSKIYNASEMDVLIAEQYNSLQAESSEAKVENRLVSNAKFEWDDEKVVSFDLGYADGQNFTYMARESEEGNFKIFKVVECNPPLN